VAQRPPVDLLSGAFFLDGARDAYRWFQDHEPVFHDDANGLWGIATYAGVLTAGRDAATFSSALGSRPEAGPMPWMIDMDAPDHSKRRRLVSGGFTPARVRAMEPRVQATCEELVDQVCERGECDVVGDLAAPMPMIVIGDLLGVDPADRADLLAWSHGMLASLTGEPEGFEAAAAAFGAYVEYAHRIIADRRSEPRDDLFSILVHAEVDGEQLTDDDIVFESLLLLIGGDETTRQVTAGGLELLLQHPDQMDGLVADPSLISGAVEEMLRCVSPIKSMARTTTRDVELEGVSLSAGAKVVLLYEAANVDERHFPEPDRFDVGRSPNEHLAFGFGPHVCLGASLARVELRAMIGCILRRLRDLELATDEPLVRSITGIERLPVRFAPSAKRSP
jgi:cytochrome P450 family 142 subfamily A polypeptide 1